MLLGLLLLHRLRFLLLLYRHRRFLLQRLFWDTGENSSLSTVVWCLCGYLVCVDILATP